MLNPFLSSVAGIDLDRERADVAEINAEAFRRCRELVNDVRQSGSTQSLWLYGDPGSGKTHLLGRLQRWLEEREQQGELSVFVPIRMVSSHRMLWRLIRERLAEVLLRRREDGARILHSVLKSSADEIAEENRNLGIALKNLLHGTFLADAAAWLKGHELPQSSMETLGLASGREDEDFEAESERIVCLLCKFIVPVPVIFCFDQLEALESYSGDSAGFLQLGHVLAALYDNTHNAAIFSCVQTGLMPSLLKGAIGSQDRDRLMRRQSVLLPLSWEQACHLASARLDTLPDLREERQKHEGMIWPLDLKILQERFPSEGVLVARKVIFHCSDLFEMWKSGKVTAEERSPESFLEDSFQARLHSSPVEKSDRVLRAGLPSLFRLRGLEYEIADPQRFSVLEGFVRGATPMAVAVCNQSTQGGALARRLEKLQNEWPAEIPSLAIFRDARRGIGRNAASTQEKLAALRKRGGRLVSVEPEAMAALNAMNELLADARSGDLDFRGDALSPASVESWLSGHLPVPLDDLFDGLGGEPAVKMLTALTALLDTERVLRLEDAASQLEVSTEEVEAFARCHPALFGVAGGNTCVLYRAISETGAK